MSELKFTDAIQILTFVVFLALLVWIVVLTVSEVEKKIKKRESIYLLITYQDGKNEVVGEVAKSDDLEKLRSLAFSLLANRIGWRAVFYQKDARTDYAFMVDSISTIPSAIDCVDTLFMKGGNGDV